MCRRAAGAREGYVFKTDDFGPGYYLDTRPVPEVTAESIARDKEEKKDLWQRQGVMRFGCLNDLAN